MELSEDIWQNANQNKRHIPTQTTIREPKVDKEVSEIVGKNILTTNEVLIKLLVEWKNKIPVETERLTDKNGKEFIVEKPVNLLKNEEFIKVLKETFV